MLAKLTAKNQLTLPKAAIEAVGSSEYFDVQIRDGQIVLTPVRIQRGDAVRAKLAALGLEQAVAAEATHWSRRMAATQIAAEPASAYRTKMPAATRPRKRASSK